MFGHLREFSRLDDSNKWSNIGFGVEIGVIEINIRKLGDRVFCPLSALRKYF